MAQPSIASGSLPMRRVTQALLLASLICSLFPSSFAQTVRDYRANPRFGTAISDAKLLAENQEYELAIASYQEANEIAHGKDKPCLRALIDVQITSGHYDEAIAATRAFRAIATTPAEKSYAEPTQGGASFSRLNQTREPTTTPRSSTKPTPPSNPPSPSTPEIPPPSC